MAATSLNRRIGRDKTICRDKTLPADERIRAARRLLVNGGASERIVPAVRVVIADFERDPDRAIRSEVSKLIEKLDQELVTVKEALETRRLAAAPKPVLEVPPVAPADADAPPSDAKSALIGGLDLLPDPSDELAWADVVRSFWFYPPLNANKLTKTGLINLIDVSWWIGEKEKIDKQGRATFDHPCILGVHASETDLDWNRTVDLAVGYAPERRALYRLESAERVHEQLIELGVKPEGYISIPDLTAKLDAAYEALQPPYVAFSRVRRHDDSTEVIRLDVTAAGRKRRFINLLRARLRNGFDVYGRKNIGPASNKLAVA